ncbi:MAG: DUF3570 domain-containing protein [Kangiellaceae bacterium]|jgi:hypothetical protein|nr:DUF3570 domain-containing protein [Kangiellaceae bacterium]
MNKFKNASQKLLKSAAALPALAAASGAPVDAELNYRYSNYSEDDVAPEVNVLVGDRSRYTIDVHQLRYFTPVGDGFSLEVNLLSESMSGASPQAVEWANGEPGLIMSGASIMENRQDMSVRLTEYKSAFNWSVEAGQSTENDYKSGYLAGGIDFSFNQNNTVLALAISLATDDITPTDAELFNRVIAEEKSTNSYSITLSQIVTKNNIIMLGYSHTVSEGFLSDPYKLNDFRPDSRAQDAVSLQWRSFLSGPDAAVHVNYRYYQDDWELDSHTIDLEWHQNFSNGIQLVPALRYYSQTEAFFYEPFAVNNQVPETFSTDFRLSPYGAISYKLAFIQRFSQWSYTVSFERYESDASFSFNNIAIENPGLVNYNRVTVGFDFRW